MIDNYLTDVAILLHTITRTTMERRETRETRLISKPCHSPRDLLSFFFFCCCIKGEGHWTPDSFSNTFSSNLCNPLLKNINTINLSGPFTSDSFNQNKL